MTGLIIDNFAGGGGASTGIEQALGRPVDVAINHDDAAIGVHTANHPGTRHFCQSIYSVDPLDATGGAPVALIWFSPDCKHFSKAKGGQPREKNIRDLAWTVPHWIERLKKATPNGRGRPQVIILENVEEFRQWGPLDDEGKPLKERQGEEFDLWERSIRRQGYKVEHRELRACDYGAPTSRKRLFLIARCDGQAIVWPKPTHGRPGSPEVLAGERLPWRTAAECIDWSLPCPSIFDRPRELKDATKRRIAAGIMRYVVNAARPFIVPITHTGGDRVHSADAPLRTVTTARRGELAVVAPHLVRAAHGDDGRERTHPVSEPLGTQPASNEFALIGGTLVSVDNTNTRASRAFDPQDPLRTVTSAGGGFAATAASLIKLRNHSEGEDPAAPLGTTTSGGLHHGVAAASLLKLRKGCVGSDLADPADTVTGRGDIGIAAATLIQAGYGERPGQSPRALDIGQPLGTVVAGGGKHAAVAAFMHKYRPNSDGAPADAPLPTVTANSFVKRGGGAAPLAVTTAHLEQANTERNGGVKAGRPVDAPMSTITVSGSHQRLVETTLIEADALPSDMMERAVEVAAFLVKYYGCEAGQHQAADAPIDTIPTKARFAVITVTIDAVTFVLVDIGMRMLEPRELANAQGFPSDYILDPVCWYVTDKGNRKFGRLPKSHQIAKIGNSVCPPMARALVAANVGEVRLSDEIAA